MEPLSTLYQQPEVLLQHLIRFDTTNPPVNEAECISHICSLPFDMLSEVRLVAGWMSSSKSSATNFGLFPGLADILRQADPRGLPMPLLLAAVTATCHFSRLGNQTYGSLPMDLPESFEIASSIHAAEECTRSEALAFGSQAVFQALQRFGEHDQ